MLRKAFPTQYQIKLIGYKQIKLRNQKLKNITQNDIFKRGASSDTRGKLLKT